ncbi:large proline-rich protein BAG6-like isoform X3 [Maniola jurtina]|uniref:large proline-rich protein BAG6-like isoform X3 n=1 Tax=Maniola jurtina TaxID=191418 RepID=UPI001E68BB01|nr:large proline-rich protein BAG6-like isoform X3 [Maniola jurtina]
MIEFTIKTLDSKDHRFSVDDEITVQQLKEKVLDQMGVEIGLQRLIFCGRVLQDEKKLADYGVHGKVIHMVQRAPPYVEAQMSAMRDRERDNSYTSHGSTITSEPINLPSLNINNMSRQQLRRLVALAATAHGIEIEEQPGPNLSPTASRLEFLRVVIAEIRTHISALRIIQRDEARTYPPDEPLESTSTGACSSMAQEVMCHIQHHRPLLFQLDHEIEGGRRGRGRRIRSMRPGYHTPPRDFGQIVEQVHELEAEFGVFREFYINTLRDASDPEVHLSEHVLQYRQRMADICAGLYHSFSHAYHVISDIGLLMNHGNTRLTSEALMRHPLPVHAHINVVQTVPTRRSVNVTAPGNGSGQAQPTEAQEAQTSAGLAGRHTTQPTVNINIQPDPVTYQVEIETAVPIPINIENVFMNGTNTNQGEPNPNNQNQNNQSQPQHNQNDAAQPNQDGPNDRRQIMFEFENIIRGLRQAGSLEGVEVVMSMEEIPQGNGGANNNNSAAEGSEPTEGGVYLAQTADILHNIVASVFRQGLVPGMEGVVHTQVQQVQGQSQTQGQRQGQGQSQAQAQTQSQAENQPQAQNQSQAPNQTPTQEQSQENQPNTEQNANANSASANQPRQQARSRGPRAHSQTVSIFNLVYDRFLPCDSLHARRQLQRRREESSQAGGPLLRDNSSTRIQNNVETLFERFDRHAIDQESLMIAAIVTLREATSFSVGRTLDPDELLPLRQRLQVYMRDMMQGEYEVGTQEQLADLIFERHSEFIERIATITPMRRNVDVTASMKAVFIRFLNEAMVVLYMENNDVFSRRFRIVFPRMFYELCGVISYCCLEGVEGLRKIYRSFLTDLIQNVDEPVRDLLHSLAMENLNAAIIRVESNKIHYPQFIRRRDQASCSPRVNKPPRPLGTRQPRYFGGLRSIDSDSESPKADEPEKPIDESDDTEDTEDSEDTKDTEETQKAQDSSPMELSPQVDAMQTSPAAPTVEPTEGSVSETTEPAANSSPDVSPPVSATGAVPRVIVTQNRGRVNEDMSSAQNASDNIGNIEMPADDSPTHNRGRFRRDEPQYGTDGNAEQYSQVNEDDSGLDWSEVPEENDGGSYDPRGRVSAMHNRGRFRKELLRYPGSGHSIVADVAGAAHRATPSPPLEPVGLEELQPVRVDSIRGRFRQETSRPASEGQSSGSAPAPLGPIVPVGPPNGLVSPRIDQNGRVSTMHSRGRYRPSRQPKSGSTTENSTDDLIFVPPAHIAQHWGEEWVPAFTRDLQRQRAAEPDEPYSDAYLTGMPPKKRRCVRQARPPTTLNAFITESVNEVSEPLGAVPGEELRATFREHVRSIARARAAASRDYEPRRFAATARFLNQPRTNARRSPENNGD